MMQCVLMPHDALLAIFMWLVMQERTQKAAKNLHQQQAERKAKVQEELAEQRAAAPRALWRLHQRGT